LYKLKPLPRAALCTIWAVYLRKEGEQPSMLSEFKSRNVYTGGELISALSKVVFLYSKFLHALS
jgi:hypothetical protein